MFDQLRILQSADVAEFESWYRSLVIRFFGHVERIAFYFIATWRMSRIF
jgi:hypothetical protein